MKQIKQSYKVLHFYQSLTATKPELTTDQNYRNTLIQIKRRLREDIKRYNRRVKDFEQMNYFVFYYDTTMEEHIKVHVRNALHLQIILENLEQYHEPSDYDCTGQYFTYFIKAYRMCDNIYLIKRCTALDV